ncbi:hypothetical protein O988_07098, partial [Pseudogymnoascus sp. VKM F-3808]
SGNTESNFHKAQHLHL